jgi:hypothetical protein
MVTRQVTPSSDQPVIPATQSRVLQEAFPDNYARPIQPGPFSLLIPNTSQALLTLAKIAPHTPAKDPEMSNLEQSLKMGGSFLIATLATWGLKQRIMGVGEFLGFLSWFGAMAFTPKAINTMVHLKTGADLNQMYATTYGERKNLYTDPNYLPLHIVPDEEMERVADRLKIPSGPNRRKNTEEKLRQISIQSRTWWMLMAGPATPVLSGIACDLLQGPLTRRINEWRFQRGMKLAKGYQDGPSAKLAKQVEKNIDRVAGESPDSMLTEWWKNFGRGILHQTGLRKAFSLKEAVDGTPEFQLQKMVKHFDKWQRDPVRLESAERYLTWQNEQLGQLEQRALDALEPFEKSLSSQDWQQQYRFIQRRFANARNTISHYGVLFDALRAGKQSPQEIRILMEKPLLNEVQRLIDTGHYTEANRLAGNPETYRKISQQLGKRQFGQAYSEMGASLDMHLRSALKMVNLRSLWRKRIPLGLGVGMLAATVVYTSLFVGRDFNKPDLNKKEESV